MPAANSKKWSVEGGCLCTATNMIGPTPWAPSGPCLSARGLMQPPAQPSRLQWSSDCVWNHCVPKIRNGLGVGQAQSLHLGRLSPNLANAVVCAMLMGVCGAPCKKGHRKPHVAYVAAPTGAAIGPNRRSPVCAGGAQWSGRGACGTAGQALGPHGPPASLKGPIRHRSVTSIFLLFSHIALIVVRAALLA